MSPTLCLKVDVCTHDGMRKGVPRLVEQFERLGVKATFCLAFGPDNSGKAIRNVFRPGFARKMVGSGAPSLYGWRTMVSGTLLPARPVASAFPDLVRRIEAEGHEVALHGWDHRRWQDHVEEMEEAEVRSHYEQAAASFADALAHRPSGSGAPAWIVTPASLAVQDTFGFAWASDLRGGPPCRLRDGDRTFATPQVGTTGRCVEELLAVGVHDTSDLAIALEADIVEVDTAVLAVHAEVEGGPYADVLDVLLPRVREGGRSVVTIGELVASLDPVGLPVRELAYTTLPGRSGRVATALAR